MSVAAHYNARPAGRGRKQGFFSRLIGGIFPVRGDSVGEVIRKIVFLTALIAFIYFGGSTVFTLSNDWYQHIKLKNYNDRVLGELNLDPGIIDSVREKVPQILPEYILGYNDNHDLVGHIKVDDSSKPGEYIINYPVYQSEDNEYYLKRSFDHSFSEGGSIFADYRNTIDPPPDGLSANTILYGHNIITGAYFAKLSRYYTEPNADSTKQLEFYKNHPVINFDTIYERGSWKVFACVLFNTQEKYGDVYDYTNKLNFYNEDEFNTFILDIMDRSVLFTDVDLTYGDSILTLSTCYYPMGEAVDTRCVIFARRVREGENPNVDVNKAVYNSNELRFEKQAQRYGTNWNGRVWDTSYLRSYNG